MTVLQEEDIEFIKRHLGEWLAEQSLGKPPAVYEIELRERMVRVEEELKRQRELIRTILEQMDKRFDAMQQQMDKRFEELTRRIERFHGSGNEEPVVPPGFAVILAVAQALFQGVGKR